MIFMMIIVMATVIIIMNFIIMTMNINDENEANIDYDQVIKTLFTKNSIMIPSEVIIKITRTYFMIY